MFFEEAVALLQRFELLECEWIDRPHDAQLALEFANLQHWRHTVRQLRCGSINRDLRLNLEFATQGVDGRLEANSHFALFNFDAAVELTAFFE